MSEKPTAYGQDSTSESRAPLSAIDKSNLLGFDEIDKFLGDISPRAQELDKVTQMIEEIEERLAFFAQVAVPLACIQITLYLVDEYAKKFLFEVDIFKGVISIVSTGLIFLYIVKSISYDRIRRKGFLIYDDISNRLEILYWSLYKQVEILPKDSRNETRIQFARRNVRGQLSRFIAAADFSLLRWTLTPIIVVVGGVISLAPWLELLLAFKRGQT